jgi:hypothetical protein
MSGRRMVQVASIALLFVCGLWLLNRPGELKPESVERIRALRVLSTGGPAGDSAAAATGQTIVYEPISAAVVDFAAVDPNAPHSDSMVERWLRGEIDLDEMESILSAAEIAALQEAAQRSGPTPGVQTATHGPGLRAPTPAGVSFDSINYTQAGGSVPPDPEMAVGLNHIIVVVNVAVAIYNKSGTALLGPVAAGALFSHPSCTSGLYDPNVLYDEEEDRYIIAFDKGAFSASGGYCLLASQSGNAMGLWNEYFFPLNNAGGWLDYPHAGVGDKHIFMGGNIFTSGGNFVEGRIYAFNKANLYTGTPVTAVALGLTSFLDTPQPINLHGARTNSWPNWGDKHYFIAEPYDGENYTLLEWDTVTLVNHGDIDIGTGTFPVQAVQSGGSNIQANDWRPLDFEYRNGYGWMTATNGCNPGGGTVNCILWAQFDLSASGAVLGPAGFGVYGSTGDHRIFPDVAANHCNDLAVGYTKTNSNMFPSVWVTGRESGDPAGQLQAEIQMKAGEIAYTAFDSPPRRWGDYSGMTIDPDGLTFWYLGEYSKNTGTTNGRWGNYVGSFTYPNCTVNATISLTQTVGTDATVCATTDEIWVPYGTDVTYCYTVVNDGDLTLSLHDLIDSGLGTLLDGFSHELPAGAGYAITHTTTALTTTTNTAEWAAYNASTTTVAEATATASATVHVLLPEIEVDPAAFELILILGQSVTVPMSVTNPGTAPLSFAIYETDGGHVPALSGPAGSTLAGTENGNSLAFDDVPWLSQQPVSGTVPVGGTAVIDVTLDAGPPLTQIGQYYATMVIASNAPGDPVTVPVTLTVIAPVYGVALLGDQEESGDVGTTVSYTIQITNTGNLTDTFDLEVSGAAWATAPDTPSVTLGPGGSATVVVTVAVPAGATHGSSDVATITVSSQGNPAMTASSNLTTTAVSPLRYIYLPLVLKP